MDITNDSCIVPVSSNSKNEPSSHKTDTSKKQIINTVRIFRPSVGIVVHIAM